MLINECVLEMKIVTNSGLVKFLTNNESNTNEVNVIISSFISACQQSSASIWDSPGLQA
jgi:hypothetical protein